MLKKSLMFGCAMALVLGAQAAQAAPVCENGWLVNNGRPVLDATGKRVPCGTPEESGLGDAWLLGGAGLLFAGGVAAALATSGGGSKHPVFFPLSP